MGWTDDNDIEEEEETENENTRDEGVDLSGLAPSAMDVREAAKKDHTFKVLWWGNEGVGKSHACYTFPEPVCFIDTEHKADDIAHKFSEKQVQIWQPDDFEEAKGALNEALSLLSEYKAQTEKNGTLVVDSMADVWAWAKYEYIDKYYDNVDPEDVQLSIEDWGPIKQIHNQGFRRAIKECDFHVAWTAPRRDDLGRKMEEGLDKTPDKPGGETNNVYKVNSIIRLRLNDEGIPVGDLQKSGLLRFKYMGLRRPTFQKHKEVVEHVQEIEENGAESAQEVAEKYSLPHEIYGFSQANTARYME